MTTPVSTHNKAPESFYRLAASVHTGHSLTEQLRMGLQELVTTTPAEVGLIFYLNPIRK